MDMDMQEGTVSQAVAGVAVAVTVTVNVKSNPGHGTTPIIPKNKEKNEQNDLTVMSKQHNANQCNAMECTAMQ